MTVDKKINYDYIEQDGVKNYVKNSESVTVPKRFKARKNAPAVKLAYITDAEAKTLKKMKKGTPHKGPKGIPSYDSFDADGNFTSGAAMSAAETGSRDARDRAEVRAEFAPKGFAPGARTQQEQDLRSAAIAAGAGQRVNPGFFDSRNVISPEELRAAKAFTRGSGLANIMARKAMRKTRGGGLMNFLTGGGIIGGLIRGLGRAFGLGKNFNEPTYDRRGINTRVYEATMDPTVNPTYYLDQDNDDLLSIISTPKTVAPIGDATKMPVNIDNKIAPLTIFNDAIAPMGVKPNKGIIEALASATAPEIMTDYVTQLEKGEPITNDEQMFIDNEIAALRGYR